MKNICYGFHPRYTSFKCIYSEEYYHNDPYIYNYFKENVCSDDPHFYQACDKKIGGKITNSELLCEYFICEIDYWGYFSEFRVSERLLEKCATDCKNTDLNKVGCEDPEITLPSGSKSRSNQICDGKCDVQRCEDEALCNGFSYGMWCASWRNALQLQYVPPGYICDGLRNCRQGEDEVKCTVTNETETFCKVIGGDQDLAPVFNYTRCTELELELSYFNYIRIIDDRVYCVIEDVVKYQTNCSDPSRVGVTCEIDGYKSSVSKYIICFHDISACDDKIDTKCLITNSCRVHKHYMCDNKIDCNDEADERDLACKSTTKTTCKRRVGIKRELPIPISWLKDGVKDCENGEDETGKWPTCGEGKRKRYVSNEETECRNVFICRTGDPGYVELENLCDGLETCGNENKICSVSNRPDSFAISVPTTDRGFTKSLSYCLPGLNNLELLANRCVTEKFQYPDEEIFGVDKKTSVILPHKQQECDYMYGEQYLYTSCTGHCVSATCPLRNIPRYEVCPSQYPDRVGTIVNNEYLIFLTKSHRGTVYSNRYFVCDDKIKCIDYSKVCDLVNDCMDGSDEAQCTNHFRCNSSQKLIPKTKKCDGKTDCFDFSDECNEECSKEILEGYFLKGLSWLIGFLAVAANLIIICKCLWVLKRCRTTVALINRLLILLIAIGDFFIGCYLLIIATYDAIVYRKSYCPRQTTWITSLECSIIGVFSTIGSQVSLFSMAGLSIVRMHGIWSSMRIPGEVTPIKSLKIAAPMLLMIFTSAAIAILPILTSFEDFFVNGLKFSDELKIFIGTSNKETALQVIKAYHGRTKKALLDWKMIRQMVKGMFSHDLDYPDLTEDIGKVDFYGNDGVCLFKYFVLNDDPQKLYVWGILALNLLCFVFISVSYLLIGILSHRSSKSLASSKSNQQVTNRNKRMNQRIAIIITTDFLCWVPFIIICILHTLEVINATSWYSIFSMIILPINSVINPLLYDDTVTKAITAPLQASLTRARNSSLFQMVRDMVSRTENEAPIEIPEQAQRQGPIELPEQAPEEGPREVYLE